MTKQVMIRDEDYDRARGIADRLGVSVDDTVAAALREFDRHTLTEDGLNPAQRAELDAMRALVAEARAHIVPGAFNDHGWLYDWDGLPA